MTSLPRSEWSYFKVSGSALTARVEQVAVWSLLQNVAVWWPKIQPVELESEPVEPSQRPPVLDEMMPDIERLIHSVAQKFSDQTSPYLQFEEMVGEGRLKLAELIDKGEVEKQPTRGNFFKLFKTCLQNQAKSRVQKYRFTEKRTGVKPPPRHERFSATPVEHDEEVLTQKQVELSLDDTDLHLQVADNSADACAWNDITRDYAALLDGPERDVFEQLVHPNEWAWAEAYVDSFYNKLPGKVVLKIKHHHLAVGLRMTDELFEEVVLNIRQKIQAYRSMTEQEQLELARQNATIAQLKLVFGVQIPPTADEMLIKRLFTIAARDQYTKLNDQVAEMLESIGAKVPRMHKDMISCYGVLFQPHARQCQACGLRKSCFVEASNLGLTRITPSVKLLGSRQIRSPVILPTLEDEQPMGNYDEAEILSYLEEYFAQFKRKADIYYGHAAETAERQVLLFCLGEQTSPLMLRFCSPSAALKKKLITKGKCWYPPEGASTQEVQALIDQHARETLHG